MRSPRSAYVDGATGRLARAGDQNVILEAFKPGTEPTGREQVLEGESWSVVMPAAVPTSRTGGLY